jgi:p-hydroxybenzoate 3-monooxygenase
VTFSVAGRTREVQCDYIAGCDGFHGVSREWIPYDKRREVERVYPFSWLGLLVEAPPISDELLYVANDSGFALYSMRSTTRSRYYLQVPLKDTLEEWPDERFWQESRNRLPESFNSKLVKGPAIEKGLARLRSFVCEPM